MFPVCPQIVTKESDGTVAAQSDSLSSLEDEELSPSSTQLTPTTAANANVNAKAILTTDTTTTSSMTENTSSAASSSSASDITPTNSGQLDNNQLFRMSSNRWDAIPEEESNESRNDSFNLTSSAEATQRLETIRNGMIQMACTPMKELTLDVEAVCLFLFIIV